MHILKQDKSNHISHIKSFCAKRQMEGEAFNSCFSSIRSTTGGSNSPPNCLCWSHLIKFRSIKIIQVISGKRGRKPCFPLN